MKKSTVLILSFLCAIPLMSLAQKTTTSPKIEVKGQSELSVFPDEATIQIRIERKAMKVAEATEELNQKAEEIKQLFEKADFSDYKFTADNYYVNINRIYQKGSSKDSGYVASQNLKVKITEIEKDLPKAVELLNSSDELSFNVSFQISKALTQSYKKQLLEMALKDAKEKAEMIASTMDLKALKVIHINYGMSQPITYPMQAEYMRLQKSSDQATAPTFNPEEHQLNDEILVTFSFEE